MPGKILTIFLLIFSLIVLWSEVILSVMLILLILLRSDLPPKTWSFLMKCLPINLKRLYSVVLGKVSWKC